MSASRGKWRLTRPELCTGQHSARKLRSPALPISDQIRSNVVGYIALFCFAILTEITGGKRRRVFRYDGYLALLSDEPRATAAVASR